MAIDRQVLEKNMPSKNTDKAKPVIDYLAIGKRVIDIESQAIRELSDILNDDFIQVCNILLACSGRIIVTGMGKSGHIARKIAATLASTGSPAFFVHAAEASHGDLGMITKKDVVIAISNSGSTSEIMTILPVLKRLAIPLILITSHQHSPLAKETDYVIPLPNTQEACPYDLTPTTSTTASLVIGDIIAIILLEARGFTKEDFGRTHPAGRLGKRLLLRVRDLMATGDDIPSVHESATVINALMEITEKRLGMTTITNANHNIVGIFTDGDLRRTIDKNYDTHQTKIIDVCSKHFKHITTQTLAVQALQLMEQYKITALVVTDDGKQIQGVIHLHHLLSAGLM